MPWSMQSPGRPDEDTRGSLAHGGLVAANADQVMAEWIGPIGAGTDGAMLLVAGAAKEMLTAWNREGGLMLTDSRVSTTGVILATYRPVD